eukprot:934821-Pyramimonas_sp.AAC.1
MVNSTVSEKKTKRPKLAPLPSPPLKRKIEKGPGSRLRAVHYLSGDAARGGAFVGSILRAPSEGGGRAGGAHAHFGGEPNSPTNLQKR